MYYFRFLGTTFDDREEWLKPELPFIGTLKDALAEAKARCDAWEKELEEKDDIPTLVIAIGTRKGHPKQFVRYPDDSVAEMEDESGEFCEYAYDDDTDGTPDGYESDEFPEYEFPEYEFPEYEYPEYASYDDISGLTGEYESDEGGYDFPEYFFSR